MKNDSRLRKYVPSLLLLLLFEAVAVTLWLMKDNLFYLLNFSYIGGCLALGYFVDDEKSVNLFLGYAVAASRLKKQLDEQGVVVDEQHPLIVYIPTGVGGAPGGVAYGLKRVYKNAVHCFFAEPTLCPSVLLGFATNLYEAVNVHDFGIDGLTEADGLACASPSGFVTRIDSNLISGDFTIEDAKLYDFMRLLHKTEDVLIEPSSCAAFIGPAK